jgi:VanZ family protein
MISWFEKHNKISWTITLAIAITIFYVSSLTFAPGLPSTKTDLKPTLYHILAYFFLAFFLLISLVKGIHKKFMLLAILLALAYSVSDEIHQSFVPGRHSSFSDILLNSIGILFASVIYSIRILNRKKL